MTRDDAENKLKKVFDDIYDRVDEAHNLMRDDVLTDDAKIQVLAILDKLKTDLVGV